MKIKLVHFDADKEERDGTKGSRTFGELCSGGCPPLVVNRYFGAWGYSPRSSWSVACQNQRPDQTILRLGLFG